MAEVTLEEPKTVVEEVEGYECDQCKHTGTEDEFYLQTIRHHHKGDNIEFDLCEDCVDAERYQTLEDAFEKKVQWKEALSVTIDAAYYLIYVSIAVGVTAGIMVYIGLGIANGIAAALNAAVFCSLFLILFLKLIDSTSIINTP